MKTLRSVLAEAPLAWLLVAVPAAVWVHHARPEAPLLGFVIACIAIIPLAGLLGLATEKLATRVGEAIGGFLNATLGNAAELIIALVELVEIDRLPASQCHAAEYALWTGPGRG